MTVVSVIFCTLSNEGFNPSAQPLRLIGAKKREQISSDSNKSFDRYRSLFLCFFHLIVFCDGSILLLDVFRLSQYYSWNIINSHFGNTNGGTKKVLNCMYKEINLYRV